MTFGFTQFSVAVTLGTVLGFGYLQGQSTFPAAKPYENAAVKSFEQTDSGYDFVASFRQTTCELVRLGVRGDDFGIWKEIKFSHNDDEEDRVKGWEIIDISLDVPEHDYDVIEIRMRHLCDDAFVDSVLAAWDVSNEQITSLGQRNWW